MTQERYDLIVVGGGPAGTTLATLVKKQNPSAKVLILEKSPFPRHHVGESLLPGLIPVLKEMGVFEKINEAGFPKKIGVVFIWGQDRKPWDADFNNLNLEMVRKYGRALDTEFSWQVLRCRYDEILLRHAQSCGVEVWEGARAVAPVEKAGRIAGLVVETAQGRRTLGCRMLADCSGQNGFLSKVRRTRLYREDLKNVAAYAYFKGAKWKFAYAGHPDKTKIFVCSVPEGWFWYIPLSADTVSVGLVSKAGHLQSRGVKDFRRHYFDALKACPEIWPLLQDATVMRGVDSASPEKDFFTARDWSFSNASACGEGWLAAGDAAFFIDPLLSSGVMMAHLSAHRAAYTISTAWRQRDPRLRRLLWRDYDLFCREVGGSFLALVQYWYHHDPNAQSWWRQARRTLSAQTPLDLEDKMSFVAVSAGLTYYFERAYTSQTLLFGSSGAEHDWQWEGTKLDLKSWSRQILAIVETGFLKGPPRGDAKVRRAQAGAALREIPDSWVARWRMKREKSVTFLPASAEGALRPIHRITLLKSKRGDAALSAANPKRVLPLSYMAILDLIDGRRTVGQIKEARYRACALPRDFIDGQVFRILKDLSVLGALAFAKPRKSGRPPRRVLNGAPSEGAPAWRLFREGEAALRRGDCPLADKALTRAIDAGLRHAWVYALRGESRRHLGRLAEASRDLDAALKAAGRLPRPGGVAALIARFDAAIERAWIEDRILILRGKLRLQRGDHAAALEDIEAALRANPRQSEALVLRAKALIAGGSLSLARRDLQAALAIEASGKKGEG